MKKIPMRKCVVTNERFPKKELVRVVRTPENEVKVDPTGKMNGHGAYLKKDAEVFEIAQRKKVLDKYLEIEVDQKVYEQLKQML